MPRWVEQAKLNPKATDGTVDILMKLYEVFVNGDADLVEINPLILTPDDKVHALDAKVSLDDNARSVMPSGTSSPAWNRSTRASAKRTSSVCSTSASTATWV